MNKLFSIALLLLAAAVPSSAIEPPDGGDMGSFKSRGGGAEAAAAHGNYRVSPDLVSSFRSRLSGAKGIGGMTRGLPGEGSPKVLVLLMEFDEYPHKSADSAEVMRDKIFGAGAVQPYESLTSYYKRSSHGKLNIQGEVLGWYKAGRRADVSETKAGREKLIARALASYSKHDFSRYDSDGDGEIDYLAVIWTGPRGAWASFWWGMKTYFSDKSLKAGSKTIGSYSWMTAANSWSDPASLFGLNTLIHETAHALGLPDYYDYKPGVGPNGGLGFLDMMDAARFDHNCFSKFLLGWVDPEIMTAGDFKLRPASEFPECALLAPPGWKRNPFSEYFLVENRRRSGNDADRAFPGEGLLVWHVDARLNPAGNGFLYDNSFTEHKLLKLMEADGLEEIETVEKYFVTQDDFYTDGRTLGPVTRPSSSLYDGTAVGLTLVSRGGAYEAAFSLSAPGEAATKSVADDVYSAGPPVPTRPTGPGKVRLPSADEIRF